MTIGTVIPAKAGIHLDVNHGGAMHVAKMFFAASTLLAAANVYAQAYPSKPIRIVVPFAAGGPADITARTIGPRMTELLGVPIVVDNRGGANGVIGAENAIKAPADGYTML